VHEGDSRTYRSLPQQFMADEACSGARSIFDTNMLLNSLLSPYISSREAVNIAQITILVSDTKISRQDKHRRGNGIS
jgi:hypothetical protein